MTPRSAARVIHATWLSVPARHWVELTVSLIILFALAVVAGLWLREPFEAASTWMARGFGLSGLFASTLAIDTLPTPLSAAPLMLLAIQGQLDVWQIMVCVSTASIIGGMLGYLIGRTFGMPEFIDRRLQTKHPVLFEAMKRHGAVGVALAGTLPLPLAIGTWTAGAMRIAFWQVAIALLVRVPKVGFYVILITSGLSVGQHVN